MYQVDAFTQQLFKGNPAAIIPKRRRFIFMLKIWQAEDGKIQMNFPIRQPQKVIDYPELLNHVIDQPFKEVYLNAQAYILVCESAQDVINATPNLPNIRKIAEQYHVSTALTAESAGYDVTITAASNDYDYVARYFAPHKGIDEDPVTGSMHTGLAPLWAEKLGKKQLIGYQASARGGKLFCDIQDGQHMFKSLQKPLK
ncbi:unnamed protein product [Oppiella nova]|uniref:PhzF family phenazine biosynthesis protein n=1 Tax=Oppiella nova TaxID=334625 RepID=A0A7R9QBM7_9ACAR|nr:unnamed protein product [Oppiella nova]CAG2161656.1 unnamed protein product [Oppiella nova]